MRKAIKKEEHIILMRSLLRDGMNEKQAEEYIKVMCKEIKCNHEKYKNIIIKKRKNKTFGERFRKDTKKK